MATKKQEPHLPKQMESALTMCINDCRIRNLSPHTIGFYRDRNTQFLDYCYREHNVTNLADVTVEHARAFITRTIELHYSTGTINHNIQSVKAFFNFCAEEGIVAKSPVERIRPQKKVKKIIPTFTEEQIHKLLTGCNRDRYLGLRDYTIILTILDTGVRVSELCGITLEDINWSSQLIRIMGKGAKERLVPFGSTLCAALREFLRRRGRIEGENHVFLTHFATPMKRQHVNRALSELAKRTGVTGARVSPHTFRHQFGKTWVMNGGDPFSLQLILGHTTQEMVSQYVNLALSDVQKQHSKFSPADSIVTARTKRSIKLR